MIRPEICPRGRDDCDPLANMISDEVGDHICLGLNKERNWPGDIYRFCLANPSAPQPGPDVCFDADLRDLIGQVAVITQGLAVHENIKDSGEE